jgi:pimeloyl-ACP methyl ester carboxylesterase
MTFLELKETALAYTRHGDGDPPLLFVHGFAGAQDDWEPQVDFFRPRRCVVTCDLRGHGVSGGDPAHCDIETYGADVGALLGALRLAPAVLVGHSLGCRVVLQAYLECPARAAGLVLIEGSRVGAGDPVAAERAMRQQMRTAGYETTMRQLFAGMFFAGADPALKHRIVRRALALPESTGVALLPRLLRWDAQHMDAALSRVAVPVLVIQSTYINPERVRAPQQPGTSTPWTDLVRQRVPAAEIEIVAGAGHFVMLEAPEAVNRSLAAFVATLGPAA